MNKNINQCVPCGQLQYNICFFVWLRTILVMTSISVGKQLQIKVNPMLETKRYRGCRLLGPVWYKRIRYTLRILLRK